MIREHSMSMSKRIPIEEQANVSGGLMSLDPGTVPGKRPPNFGQKEYLRLVPLENMVSKSEIEA